MHNTRSLVAVRNAEKTRHLVSDDAYPRYREERQKNEAEQEHDRMRQKAVAGAHGAHDWSAADHEGD